MQEAKIKSCRNCGEAIEHGNSMLLSRLTKDAVESWDYHETCFHHVAGRALIRLTEVREQIDATRTKRKLIRCLHLALIAALFFVPTSPIVWVGVIATFIANESHNASAWFLRQIANGGDDGSS